MGHYQYHPLNLVHNGGIGELRSDSSHMLPPVFPPRIPIFNNVPFFTHTFIFCQNCDPCNFFDTLRHKTKQLATLKTSTLFPSNKFLTCQTLSSHHRFDGLRNAIMLYLNFLLCQTCTRQLVEVCAFSSSQS